MTNGQMFIEYIRIGRGGMSESKMGLGRLWGMNGYLTGQVGDICRVWWQTFVGSDRGHLSGMVGDIYQAWSGTFVGAGRGHLSISSTCSLHNIRHMI